MMFLSHREILSDPRNGVWTGRRSRFRLRAEDIGPGAMQPSHDLLDLRQGGALLPVNQSKKSGRGNPDLLCEILE